ncbi:hypothetical protein J6590_041754 [Homalodisca vitripennis]|nr:hypothetical protein J6590_041754 [Homalodisca vitripennis]
MEWESGGRCSGSVPVTVNCQGRALLGAARRRLRGEERQTGQSVLLRSLSEHRELVVCCRRPL